MKKLIKTPLLIAILTAVSFVSEAVSAQNICLAHNDAYYTQHIMGVWRTEGRTSGMCHDRLSMTLTFSADHTCHATWQVSGWNNHHQVHSNSNWYIKNGHVEITLNDASEKNDYNLTSFSILCMNSNAFKAYGLLETTTFKKVG